MSTRSALLSSIFRKKKLSSNKLKPVSGGDYLFNFFFNFTFCVRGFRLVPVGSFSGLLNVIDFLFGRVLILLFFKAWVLFQFKQFL